MMLIAQITDLHITEPGRLMLGEIDTSVMLARAVERINRLTRQPDLVVVTGDLTDDGTAEQYDRVRPLLDRLAAPWIGIVGNHDERAPFRAAFAGRPFADGTGDEPVQFVLDTEELVIVGLDSTAIGFHHAEFCPIRAAWLAEELVKRPGKPHLILIHHPPVRTFIDWMDVPRTDWAGELEAVIAGRTEIVGILSGHLHRPIVGRFAGHPVIVSASVSHQLDADIQEAAMPAVTMEPASFMLHVFDGQQLLTHQMLVHDDWPRAQLFTTDPADWARKKAEVVARGTQPK